MATHSSTSTVPSNSTDANFRSWINFIHDLMIAAGWNQTADTGQINFATVTAPGAADTKQGYAIYEMTDALAATYPIIIKFAFGSGSATNNPGIWFAVGTHTDGAGNFIDPNDENRSAWLMDQYTQTQAPMRMTGATATAHRSFGSGDGGRVVFAMFEGSPEIGDALNTNGVVAQTKVSDINNRTIIFSIERARDWDGAYIGTHVAMVWSATVSIPNRSIYFESEHGHVLLSVIGATVHGLGYAQGTQTFAGSITSGASGPPLEVGTMYSMESLATEAPASPPIHFLRNTLAVPPGINIQYSRWSRFQFTPWPVSDWTNPPDPASSNSTYITGKTIAISPYGVPRTYRTVAGLRAPIGIGSPGSVDPTVWVYILYE
jgi:hypothetical protein